MEDSRGGSEQDAVSVDVPEDVGARGKAAAEIEMPGGDSAGQRSATENDRGLAYCLRLHDSGHDAIRVLIIGEKCELGLTK